MTDNYLFGELLPHNIQQTAPTRSMVETVSALPQSSSPISGSTSRTSMPPPRVNPWTRIGRSFTPTADATTALALSGLDWSVEKVGLRTADLAPVPDRMAIRRNDSGAVLGVVGEDYQPLQNSEAFAFFKEVAGEGRLSFETAGGFGHGEVIWVQARLPDHDIRMGDDVSESYLFISSGHVGNRALTIAPTTIRIVCRNTLRMAEAQHGAKRKVKQTLATGFAVRHTKGMKEALADIRQAYAQTIVSHAATKEAFTFLSGKPMTEKLKDEFYDLVFPAGIGPDESDRAAAIAKTRRDRLEAILASPTSQVKGTKDTAFSLLQSAIEFIDHDRTTRTSEGADPASSRLFSSTFGSGSSLKDKAWAVIHDLVHA